MAILDAIISDMQQRLRVIESKLQTTTVKSEENEGGITDLNNEVYTLTQIVNNLKTYHTTTTTTTTTSTTTTTTTTITTITTTSTTTTTTTSTTTTTTTTV